MAAKKQRASFPGFTRRKRRPLRKVQIFTCKGKALVLLQIGFYIIVGCNVPVKPSTGYACYPSNSLTPPSAPTTNGAVPSGLWTYPNFNGYRYIYVSQSIRTNGSRGGWTAPVIYSLKPDPGDPGSAIVCRGLFASAVYYNNGARRDVAQYNGTYYIYKGADGATVSSWNPANRESFGAQFSSVATDILLAPNANIGGWVIKTNGWKVSREGCISTEGQETCKYPEEFQTSLAA
ncbi:MAG: hypothetical protein LBK65_10095 [Tannerellaceae bacterium]|jgi:hypothetical protein|nr:hypothetical protein [Tannerellaceae bacterium]